MTKKTGTGFLLVVILATASLTLAFYILYDRNGAEGTLEASGRIEGRMISLTAKTTGTVHELLADEGEDVVVDAVLAVLDDDALQARLESARAALDALKKQLEAADIALEAREKQIAAQIDQAQAQKEAAAVRLDKAHDACAQAKHDAERYNELAKKGAATEKKSEDAVLAATLAHKECELTAAGLKAMEKGLELAILEKQTLKAQQTQRDALAAQVEQAKAILAEQQSYVDEFTVKSPLAGTILSRAIEKGERVMAGAPLFTLVDMNRLYVKVYIAEPDIGKIVLGGKANIMIDSYPEHSFPARITKVAQQAEFTPKNVETKDERVKLVFAVELSLSENPGNVLKPGMPADALIETVQPEMP